MSVAPIHIEFIRKPIRRMHLHVYPDGRVVVTMPWLMPKRIAQQFVQSQWDWVLTTMDRLQHQPPRVLPTVSKQQADELIAFLTERVEYWRIRMNEEPVTWKVRNMKTQWGNCRPKMRRLTFNLQLALVDNNLRDYIIVHELSHLQVPNHGPLFKARQSLFLPDWPARRQRLKNHQRQC